MRSPLTTLCYVECGDSYLMLHRVSKKNDVNKDKWIGIGGHFEEGESPEECLLREAYEETGLRLTSWKFRGIVTFVAEGETVDTIVVDWGTVLTDEDYPEAPAKEGYTGKWIIPADGITGDTTIVPEYTKAAPPVDTGDYAPIALPVALAGIAALVFCMKKREEDAE